MNISKKSNLRPTIENRQARFNYELLDDFEAGISLEGWEVKSIRNGQIELKNAYVVLKKRRSMDYWIENSSHERNHLRSFIRKV